MTEQSKDAASELFKACRPDVRKLNAEGRKQCRLKARKEFKDRFLMKKDFVP